MLEIKILSYKSPQRFAVKRTLMAAYRQLLEMHPACSLNVIEVNELSEMEKYTPVVILPSLVVNDVIVCVGRFPSKEEILGWLEDAMNVQLM